MVEEGMLQRIVAGDGGGHQHRFASIRAMIGAIKEIPELKSHAKQSEISGARR
jgi:hypothetical protein